MINVKLGVTADSAAGTADKVLVRQGAGLQNPYIGFLDIGQSSMADNQLGLICFRYAIIRGDIDLELLFFLTEQGAEQPVIAVGNYYT